MEEAKKPANSIILPFLAGFLAASLLLGGLVVGWVAWQWQGTISREHMLVEETELDVVTAMLEFLTPVRSSDVNNLQFSTDEINNITVQTTNGSINVTFHDEDFISIHCSQSSSHTVTDTYFSARSLHGTFTIMLPESTLDTLTLNTTNGRINIDGAEEGNVILAENLRLGSVNGNINLTNLAVPGSLSASTTNGSIIAHNTLSDAENTSLSTTFGRIISD